MNIYAIFVTDSKDSYNVATSLHSLFLNENTAKEFCERLNNPEFIKPTKEEWLENCQNISYEDYCNFEEENFNFYNMDINYFVRELTTID